MSRIEVALFLLTKMDTILSNCTRLNRPLSIIKKGAFSITQQKLNTMEAATFLGVNPRTCCSMLSLMMAKNVCYLFFVTVPMRNILHGMYLILTYPM